MYLTTSKNCVNIYNCLSFIIMCETLQPPDKQAPFIEVDSDPPADPDTSTSITQEHLALVLEFGESHTNPPLPTFPLSKEQLIKAVIKEMRRYRAAHEPKRP